MMENTFEDTLGPPPESYFSKKLISPGDGFHSPIEGATCSLSIECLEPGELNIPVGYPLGHKVEIKIGEGDTEIAENIDRCLLGMKKGETSEITVYVIQEGSQDSSGDNMSMENGLYSEYVFKIRLRSFDNLHEIYKMTNEEKLEIAKWHKSKGVELFKSGDTKFAFRRFSKALKYLIIANSKQDLPADFKEVKCQCYLNIAACQLKYESYNFVMDNCTKALKLNPKALKGLVRRGRAYLGLNNIDKALIDLRKALQIEPNNRYVRELVYKCINKETEEARESVDGQSRGTTVIETKNSESQDVSSA